MNARRSAGSIASLQTPVDAPGVILVYLYEDECPACSEFESSWRLFKEMHRGEATFLEMDVSGPGGKLAKRFGVKYLPAVLVFRGGVLADRMEGFPDLKDLEYSLLRAKEGLAPKYKR
jgi:thioredoxin-like negative regulator of GroEL